jgi:hypothetical protein
VSGKNRGKKRFEQIVENVQKLHRIKVVEKNTAPDKKSDRKYTHLLCE